MSRGTVYQTREQHGSGTTSNDYNAYLSMLSRMHSVTPDAPQYPSVHKAFNNRVIQEEQTVEVRQDYVNKKNPSNPPKKVQVMEQVQFIEQDGDRKSEVIEEGVDNEANSFIQQKRKGFELCKWKTFKFP